MSGTQSSRLDRLRGFLEADPQNLNLLADTASAAFDERNFTLAAELIDRHTLPLPAALVSLKGLIALAEGRNEDAVIHFTEVRTKGTDAPALRFNLAWSQGMVGAYSEALALLDDDAIGVSPNAPALKIRMMHHLQLFDEALASGQVLAERYPDNQELMGALATLALDAERADLALLYAQKAGNNPEGQTTLGFLELGNHNTPLSLELCERALAEQPTNARAWIGKGLGQLMSGDINAGTEAIDRGAELFGTHLGSWIASGWAHFLSGDNAGARASFERALAIDPNFSEGHGGLAVVAIATSNLEEGKHHATVASRLNKKSFSALLAKSMLYDSGGHAQAAKKLLEMGFATPVRPGGLTLAQEIAAFGTTARPRQPKAGASR